MLGKMWRILWTGSLGALFIAGVLYASFAEAQVMAPPFPLGKYVEAEIEHVECMGVKYDQHPFYFVVKTNRPDLFFENLELVRRCLSSVKTFLEDPKKYGWSYKDIRSFERVQPPGTAWGESAFLTCLEFRKKGFVKAYEFVFPYFKEEELALFTHETTLRQCLNSAEPVHEILQPPPRAVHT